MNIEWYLWYLLGCGFLAQVWIALQLGRIHGRVVYAIAAACSLTRFAWACARVHGFRERRLPAWVYLPQVWGNFFLIMLGERPGSVEHFGGNGTWRGIGNWTVKPRQ